jgi:hypothetical protein
VCTHFTGKNVLKRHFEYFEAMFRNSFSETEDGLIQLPTLYHDSFLAFWTFVVTGKLVDMDYVTFVELYDFGSMIHFPALQATTAKWILAWPEASRDQLKQALQLAMQADDEVDVIVQREVFRRLQCVQKREEVHKE